MLASISSDTETWIFSSLDFKPPASLTSEKTGTSTPPVPSSTHPHSQELKQCLRRAHQCPVSLSELVQPQSHEQASDCSWISRQGMCRACMLLPRLKQVQALPDIHLYMTSCNHRSQRCAVHRRGDPSCGKAVVDHGLASTYTRLTLHSLALFRQQSMNTLHFVNTFLFSCCCEQNFARLN